MYDSDEGERSYRLEIAVDDLLPVQHLQTPEKRVGEATNQSQAEALEVVLFDELVQVDPGKPDKRRIFITSLDILNEGKMKLIYIKVRYLKYKI